MANLISALKATVVDFSHFQPFQLFSAILISFINWSKHFFFTILWRFIVVGILIAMVVSHKLLVAFQWDLYIRSQFYEYMY